MKGVGVVIMASNGLHPGKGHFAEDLTGQVFGELTVLGRAPDYVRSNGQREARWQCQCSCGSFVNVSSANLRNGVKFSCGCVRRPRKAIGVGLNTARVKPNIDRDLLPRIGNLYDLSNLKFGRLTALRLADDYVPGPKTKLGDWLCVCDCGTERVVNAGNLLSGHTCSCGCLQRDVVRKIGTMSGDDLTGRTFGRWFVVGRSDDTTSCGNSMWHCRCECGVERDVRNTALTTGASLSCGCIKAQVPDIVGKTFGYWTVLDKADSYVIANRSYRAWRCRCACGVERNVLESSLLAGGSLSCGCVRDVQHISKAERYVMEFCDEHDVQYKAHVTYSDLKGLGGGYLSYDFMLYDGDRVIGLVECQGQQHYRPVEIFGGEAYFEVQKVHDALKRDYACEHGLKLLEISYRISNKFDVFDVLEDFCKL